MKQKISRNTEMFLKYGFKGNGKYRTTTYGSKRYNNTSFQTWRNANADCYTVTGHGNDAPRGGKIGDYVIVEFTLQFYLKYQWYLDTLKTEQK